ncbi:MAG TPA: biliverdin-producing heme oxygenase [Cellvibrio sp.]|nr:biliverdin-producing heme oxygenase [Cellvibrio sp.]
MEIPLAIKPSIRQRLREETAAIHESLHHNVGLEKLTSIHCTRADYISVLTLFLHFYRAVDELFEFVQPRQRFIHEATPLHWLEQDFRALNHPLPERSALLADFIEQPFATGFETYIGYLYVKQGSTLGGQTIGKRLNQSLSLVPGENQFFFNGFGEQTGIYWKEFLNYLSLHEASLDADMVIKSAQTYFDILNQFSNRYFCTGI